MVVEEAESRVEGWLIDELRWRAEALTDLLR
jgi:hypothetical protein